MGTNDQSLLLLLLLKRVEMLTDEETAGMFHWFTLLFIVQIH